MDKSHWALVALSGIETLAGPVGRADHIDVVEVRGTASLREFVAVFLGRRPVWLRLLYRMRAGLARVFGLKHPADGRRDAMAPGDVPMEPGAGCSFFTVVAAAEDRHWVAVADDKHLQAFIAIVTEALPTGGNRFAVVTVVCFRNWIGPLYFTAIRLFHTLIVGHMAAKAAGQQPAHGRLRP